MATSCGPPRRPAWGARVYEWLKGEAFKALYDGVFTPVYQGGEKVGTVTEYSDTLLTTLLKGKRPDTFRERVEGRILTIGGWEQMFNIMIASNVPGVEPARSPRGARGVAPAETRQALGAC